MAPASARAQHKPLRPTAWLKTIGSGIVQASRGLWARAAAKWQRPAMLVRPRLKFSDLWIAFIRLVAFAVILTGLSFGAKQTYFPVGVSQFLGTEIDADTKLALLGLINKSLDVILVASLEYTASMLLTVWMARGKRPMGDAAKGATFNDFGLKDELTKPWMTLVSFATRWRRSKWSWTSLLRCLLCLCVSISVMLQGLAVNTIAVPKVRWYPNHLHTWALTDQVRKSMTLEHPKPFLQAVAWFNLLGVGQSTVGEENYPPYDWALGLSAALSFTGLTHVVSTVARPEKHWQHVYRWQLDGDARRRWTGLNTAFRLPGDPVETISADDEQATEIFEWLRSKGHKPTVSSIGWTGNLTLVVPALNTLCTPTNQSSSARPFIVTVPDADAAGNASFSIHLGPVPAMNFPGATCTSTFRQALFGMALWIVEMGPADLSFNNWGTDWTKRIEYAPPLAADRHIVRDLAIQTRDTLPRIETLVQSASLLDHFLLASRRLQKADSGIPSDVAGLSIVMGVLLQNMLSLSNKYRSPLPDSLSVRANESVVSYPMQWQLYGSGPRLAWEWAVAAVLAIVLGSLCFGVWQTVRLGMGPGPWTELGGMMMIAQKSPPLADMDDVDKAQKRVYTVEESAQGCLQLESKPI